jgi:hypothetical protein
MLPLIVVGLVVPGAAGMVIGGPGLGVAAGELCALAVVLVAALQRPDEPIEVAAPADARSRLLLLAAEGVDEPMVLEQVLSAAGGIEAARRAEVLVVAPARGSALSQWLSDVEPAREEAQVRLVHAMAGLAAAGVDSRGRVGDADPLQAAEDALRSFPATRVVVVTGDDLHDRAGVRAAEQLRSRLRIPLSRVAGAAAPQHH